MTDSLDLRETSRDEVECTSFLAKLSEAWTIHVIKLYRIELRAPPRVPILPCLDHEAALHANVAPHASAYVTATKTR